MTKTGCLPLFPYQRILRYRYCNWEFLIHLKQLRSGERKRSENFRTMVKLYYKDDYATIELDDEVPCIKLTLQGTPRFSEHYQHVQSKRLELIQTQQKNFGQLHLLTDSRAAGPVLDEDVDYFKNHVLPEIEEAGIKFLAVVMPAGKITRLTIQEMRANASKIEVQTFERLRDARAWLKTKTEVTT